MLASILRIRRISYLLLEENLRIIALQIENKVKHPVSLMNKINSEINAPCRGTGFSNVRNKRQVLNVQARMRKGQDL